MHISHSDFHKIRKQHLQSMRRNALPVEFINWSLLMCHEDLPGALRELLELSKTPSSSDLLLHHAPKAFDGIEVMATMRWQEMQPQLLVPVCQRRRKLVRPVDATAVRHHDHLFPGGAKRGHHLMDRLAKPLHLTMGDDLIEDFGSPLLDSTNDAEQDPTGHAPPTAIAYPRLTLEALFAFALTLRHWPRGEAIALGCAPPARPGQRKAPEDGFVFIEENDLAAAGSIFKSSKFERGIREVRGLGIKSASRAAGVQRVFFRTQRTLSRPSWTPGWGANTAASSRQLHGEEIRPCWRGS